LNEPDRNPGLEEAVVREQMLNQHTGRHLCLQYSSEKELGAILGEFVRGGLVAGEQIGYITGSDAATVLRRLASEGVAWEAALRSSTLVLICLSDLETGPDGSRTTATVARVKELVKGALSRGYPAVRVASEVHALAPEAETIEQMRAREALADGLTASFPLTRLCLYDRRHFGDAFLTAAARVHDNCMTDDLIYFDDIATITRSPRGGELRIAGEIDAFNAVALRRAVADMAHGPAARVTLDVSALRFVDVAGLRGIVEVARARPHTMLTLTGATAKVVRMLEMCGWAQMPNLVVSTRERPR
jgi:anti-anti-sigma factor